MPPLAQPHLMPAGERVAIPFEGRTLAGILRMPSGSHPEVPRARRCW